jgi:hypothetical protein
VIEVLDTLAICALQLERPQVDDRRCMRNVLGIFTVPSRTRGKVRRLDR